MFILLVKRFCLVKMHVKNSRVTVKEKKCLNLNKLASQKLQWVQTQKSPKKRLLSLSKGPGKEQASKTEKLLNNNYLQQPNIIEKTGPIPTPIGKGQVASLDFYPLARL